MAVCGLVGAHSRRKWRRGRPDTAPAPDLLERDFTAARSDQRWVADITEFRCCEGKLYLAGIKDLHDQELASWSMGERQTTDLVVNALMMALARRQPCVQAFTRLEGSAEIGLVAFPPDSESWQAGSRSVGCLAYDRDGDKVERSLFSPGR